MTAKYNKTLKSKIYQLLFALLIFTLPSNLFLKFAESYTYINGLQIDYLIPKFYLSDIFILLILLVWFFFQFQHLRLTKVRSQIKKNFNFALSLIGGNKILTSLFFVFIIRQFSTAYPLASIWYFAKILELFLLGVFIYRHRQPLFLRSLKKTILWTIFLSLIFQSLLAIYQYHTQTSFLGYLFLGEPNLTSYMGLATHITNGVEKILPYGTTAHPNILGGILAIYLIFIINFLLKKYTEIYKNWQDGQSLITAKFFSLPKIVLTFLIILISGYALYLTHSISAWLALTIGILLIITKKMFPKVKLELTKKLLILSLSLILLAPFLINFFSRQLPKNSSLFRRAYLNTAAWQIFKKSSFWGIGLNNFTTRVEEYSQSKEATRFAQPVHNIGLLFLSENGLLGMIILLILIYKLPKKTKLNPFLLTLIPIAILDHYLLTTQSGLLLLIFTFLVGSQGLSLRGKTLQGQTL